MSFTDQKPRVATAEDCAMKWGGAPPGVRFRCYLCGHKFAEGDVWRWVHSTKFRNFLVCDRCDGPRVEDKWEVANRELETRFWWALDWRDI